MISIVFAWSGFLFLAAFIGWHGQRLWKQGKKAHSVLLLLSLLPVGHGHGLLLEHLETEAAKSLIEEALE